MAHHTPDTVVDDVAAPKPKRSHKKQPPAPARSRLDALERENKRLAPPPPPKPNRARTAQAAALRKGLEDYPAIDILERRLLNPEGTPSEPIQLRGQSEPMELRWINTELPGRYHEVTRYGGYVPVRTEELRDKNEVSDLQESPDGYVTRGERGREVLMKIPKRYYDAIQRKRAEIELRKLRSSAGIKRTLMEEAGGQSHTYKDADGQTRTISGDEAAHGVGQFFGEITSSRERIQFVEGGEEA